MKDYSIYELRKITESYKSLLEDADEMDSDNRADIDDTAARHMYDIHDAVSDIDMIYNEDCETTMKHLSPQSVDIVLTSPPYDTTKGRMARSILNKRRNTKFPSSRYDVFTAD